MNAAQVISDKAEIHAYLAKVCHAYVQYALIQDIPIANRFNSGDRQVIIELYGKKIIELSRSRILRFQGSVEGIDVLTAFNFDKKIKVIDDLIRERPFAYDVMQLVTLVMNEFAMFPKYKNYSLVLS